VRYELWQDEGTLSFFANGDDSMRRLLSPAARLVWTCDACTWADAQALKHQHLGWEPYKPLDMSGMTG